MRWSTPVALGALCVALSLLHGQAFDSPPAAFLLGRTTDSTGAVLPGCVVTLSGRTDGAQTVVRTLLSNRDGKFLFDRLEPGEYSVTGTASGYLTAMYGQRHPATSGRRIRLFRDEARGEIVLVLWRASYIAGRVTNGAGTALAGISVSARLEDGPVPPSGARLARTAISDDRGEYRIEALSPGDYLVWAGLPARSQPAALTQQRRVSVGLDVSPPRAAGRGTEETARPLMFGGVSTDGWTLITSRAEPLYWFQSPGRIDATGIVFLSGSRAPTEASHVLLTAGTGKDQISFVLDPSEAQTVSGAVEGSDATRASIGLRLFAGSTDSVLAGGGVEVGASVTDPAGRFRFLAIPEGEYVLVATHRSQDAPVRWAVQAVSVGSGSPPVSVRLNDGLLLAGKVQIDGPPPAHRIDFSQSVVRLDPLFTIATAQAGVRATVDETGRFSAQGLLPGTYRVRPIGPKGWAFTSAAIGNRILPADVIRLSTDQTDLTVKFTDHVTVVRGTVADNSAGGVTSATVLLFPSDPRLWTANDSRRLRRLSPGDDGTYTLVGVPPGDYLLLAVSDSRLPDNWPQPDALAKLMLMSPEHRLVIRPADIEIVKHLAVRMP